MHTTFRLECVKATAHLRDLGSGGKIILKLKFKKLYTRGRLDSRTGIDGGRRKHEFGTLFSKKGYNYLNR
jgi:hypothetical protein